VEEGEEVKEEEEGERVVRVEGDVKEEEEGGGEEEEGEEE
jgi:hypothetical protein